MKKLYPLLLVPIVLVLAFRGASLSAAEAPLKTIKGWGKVVDPKGDCSVEEKGGVITMSVVGRHDLSIELGQQTDAPRVMRDIEGDFIATVKLSGMFRATGPSTVAMRRPFVGAGFLLWHDERNYVRLERASADIDGEIFEYLSFEERRNGEFTPAHSELDLKSEPVVIRLERRNGKLYGSATYDRELWQGYPPIEIDMPAKLQLGVAAISSSAGRFVPEFSEFEVYRREPPDAP